MKFFNSVDVPHVLFVMQKSLHVRFGYRNGCASTATIPVGRPFVPPHWQSASAFDDQVLTGIFRRIQLSDHECASMFRSYICSTVDFSSLPSSISSKSIVTRLMPGVLVERRVSRTV